MRATSLLRVRLPKARRPRERPWDIFNTREFGFSEGSQNYSMWLLTASTYATLLLFESCQQMLRILVRGDTCSACDAAREHYRQRVAEKEREMQEAFRRSGHA
ncbi:hypothetical protein TraAM80_05986 [Trypanosoma rangeli]|uniref:Uncharacterized protein n=1 Tax=Trypanosoma rangeli TaxID=5698 RepID=A0A422NCA7_TRYRA|nr:uncharacterized protein TraAM80_05986 [Trypanosoma rangeli]RNF03118.1 hypothetical protein TraAM80_05986 [Trypanosoma rangeli]|eukprot:RNF03118.1 hypothetical protein TraAM80_05986 [Trypanosoma rangeli]